MKIGLVIFGEPFGGRENVVFQLQRYFQKLGHKVYLISNSEFFGWTRKLDCEKIDLGPMHSTKLLISKIFKLNVNFPKVNILNPLLQDLFILNKRRSIINKLNTIKLDILNFHEQSSLRLFDLNYLKIPSVYTFHGDKYDWITGENKLLGYRKKGFSNTKKKIDNMNGITSVSNDLITRLRYQGLNKPIELINNGIDLRFIESINPGIKDKTKFTLFFPGGSDPNKGGLEIAKAINNLRGNINNLKLIVTKKFNYDSKFYNYIMDNSLFEIVEIHGQVSNSKNIELMKSSDVAIQPSKKEAFSVFYLEAMACGLPIIATGNSGVLEQIENQINGILVSKHRTSDEISEAIQSIYYSKSLRKKFSDNNIIKSKDYDWLDISQKYLNYYTEVIKNA